MHFFVPTFSPYFHFGPYFFIFMLLVPKIEKIVLVLVPTIILLTNIAYVAHGVCNWHIRC